VWIRPVYSHILALVVRVETLNLSLFAPILEGTVEETHAQVFVCLPCYNEAENLAKLLRQIHSTFKILSQPKVLELQPLGIENYQILAVNDGSTDNTEEILQDFAKIYPLTVINHNHNQGLAETCRTLIGELKKQARDGDIAIFMDADNTHPPQIIKDMVKVVSTTAEVVVASRYKEGTELGVPFKRRVLSKIVNWLIRNLCGISILDCTSGYRAYRMEVLKTLPCLESKGFEVTAEILIKVSAHKPAYKIREIPLELHYYRKKGSSKIHVGRTIKAYVNLFWKYGKIDLTPFVKQAAYKISHRHGKT